MKLSVNGEDVIEISEIQKKVICNDIRQSEFDSDMKRRVHWIWTHKYEQCFKRLKEHWEPILASRVDSIPTNPVSFAQLVFSQPDYKCRETREIEEEQQRAEQEQKKPA